MTQPGVPTNVFSLAQTLYDSRQNEWTDHPAELVSELEHIAALTALVVQRLQKSHADAKASTVSNDRPVFLFGQIKSEIGKDDEVYLHELDSKPVAVKANAKVTRFDPVPQYEKMQPAFPTPDISAMMESLKINVPVKAKYQWILPSHAEREAELARTCTSTGSSSVTVNDLLHGTPPSAATMPTLKSALNLLPSSFRPHYNSATRKPVLIAYCKLYVHPNRAYLRRLLVKSERH